MEFIVEEGESDDEEETEDADSSGGDSRKVTSRKKSTKKATKTSTAASSAKTAKAGKPASKKDANKPADAKSATKSPVKSATKKSTVKKPAVKKPAVKKPAAKPTTETPDAEDVVSEKTRPTKSAAENAPHVSQVQDPAVALYLKAASLRSQGPQSTTTIPAKGVQRRPGRGPHCNMTNTTNTCYLSSTLQHFSKIDELRDVFRGPSGFRAITGHPDSILPRQYGDPSGSKLESLYEAAQQVFQGLEQSPVQLSGDFTNLFFNALQSLSQLWQTSVFEDSRDFFAYFAEAMICITDRSQNLNLGRRVEKDGVIYKKTPEARALSRHEEDVVQAEDLPSLSEFATKIWQAHRRCGHESPLFDLLAIQTVDELACNSQYCGAVAWEPEYHLMLRLNLPQDAKSADTFSPAQLEGYPKSFSLATLEPPRKCWRCSNNSKVTVTDGKFSIIRTEIVRVPPLLAIHIARTRHIPNSVAEKPIKAPVGSVEYEEEKARRGKRVLQLIGDAEITSFENKMVDMEQLNLADLNVQLENLVQDVNSNPSLLYDLIGIWLHSKQKQHWVACIREGRTTPVALSDKMISRSPRNVSICQKCSREIGPWPCCSTSSAKREIFHLSREMSQFPQRKSMRRPLRRFFHLITQSCLRMKLLPWKSRALPKQRNRSLLRRKSLKKSPNGKFFQAAVADTVLP
jgi:ubiquitin C-terminal hydrolase